MISMNNSGVQRLVPIALVLIVIVVAIAALVSLGRSIFGGSTEEPVVDTGREALLNTALDRSLRMTVRGPIVADENFHSYTIVVSPTTRVLTTYEGYLDRQVDTKQMVNNTRSYEQFVHALERVNLTDTNKLEGEAAEMRGICATGKVYQFEIMQASNVVKKIWTTTCREARGSLKANVNTIVKLFQSQIPKYSDLTQKVRL